MSSTSGRRVMAVVAAACAGWVVALATPRDFIVGTFQDDAQYAVLAKSIREEHTYRNLNFPGQPYERKFAPGWPAVLALAWKPGAGGEANLQRLRWVNLMLVGPLAGVIALAGMAVFGLPAALSAIVAVASVASPAEQTWWAIPMSEPLCLALLALGLVLVAGGRFRGAAVTLAAAVYVRSIAAPFLVGLVIACVWKQGWKRAVQPALIGALLLAPWIVHVLANGHGVSPVLGRAGYGSYADLYGQGLSADPRTMLLTVPLVNAPMIVQAVGQALLGWHWAPRALEVVLGLAIDGLVVTAGRSRPVFWIGLGLYVVTVLLWLFPQEDRFVGSVWPLLLLAVLAALPWPRVRWWLVGVTVLTATLGFVNAKGIERHRQRSRSSVALLDSMRTRIPPGALVATSNPPLTYLKLGNPTMVSWSERSYRWYSQGYWATAWGLGDDLWAIIRAYRPDYLIIERRGAEGRYAAGSLIRQCPGVLEQVWGTPGGEFLFAVHGGLPCAPETTRQ